MMKKSLATIAILLLSGTSIYAQDTATLLRLARMPLKSITTEYPNKTGQVITSEDDAKLTPSELHPAFYGSFDWHSSVHSHWMLVRTLRVAPQIELKDSIINALDQSLTTAKLQAEADYFKRPMGASYERAYGWAWLLKLDEELFRLSQMQNAMPQIATHASRWHHNLKPLTDKIVELWQNYLPKISYPDRIGTHTNTAFALGFAYDWAMTTGNSIFAKQIRDISLRLYAKDQTIPAEWEPNATDFFSPSLLEADLMRRIMPVEQYRVWLKSFFTPKGLHNLCTPPFVSDLNDYHIVHLVGLSFSRAWCMANIANALPEQESWAKALRRAATLHYNQGMQQIFQSNYGGDHWLGSFAAYAYEAMNTPK